MVLGGSLVAVGEPHGLLGLIGRVLRQAALLHHEPSGLRELTLVALTSRASGARHGALAV